MELISIKFTNKDDLSNFKDFQCEEMGNVWSTYPTNFDNIINAMVTLFIISSRELWPDIMYLCVDSDQKEYVNIFKML